jgi:two-component system sensor histidine kinase DesK
MAGHGPTVMISAQASRSGRGLGRQPQYHRTCPYPMARSIIRVQNNHRILPADTRRMGNRVMTGSSLSQDSTWTSLLRRRTALHLVLGCVLAYLPVRIGFFVYRLQWDDALTLWRAGAGITVMCTLFVVYLLVVFRSVRWLLPVLALLTFAPYLTVGPLWPHGISGLLVSALLLRLKLPASYYCCGIALVGEAVVIAATYSPTDVVAILPWLFHPVSALGIGLALFAVVRLYESVRQAREATQELTALEVGTERARIASTLRTALGVTLSTLIHQGRRLREDPDRHKAEDLAWLAGGMTAQARSLADAQQGTDIPEIPREDAPDSVAPRLAWFLSLAFAGYYAVVAVWNFAWFGLEPLQWVVAMVMIAITVVLHMYHGAPRPFGPIPRRWQWTLGLYILILVATVPYFGYGGSFGMLYLAGGVALVRIRAPWSWVSIALILPLVLLMPLPEPINWGWFIYVFSSILVTSIAVFALCSLPEVDVYLRSTRGELARLAVLGERLRLARDIHDLLSFHLSGLAIKAELVKRTLTEQPDQARSHLRELIEDAQRALGEVRSIGIDPVEPNLKDELSATRTLLAAAGIQTQACLPNDPFPAHIDTLLAIVLREGVTNVIRHSTAQSCQIKGAIRDEVTRLSISNDGARKIAPAKRHGTGLANLETRVSGAGGRVIVERHDDGLFTLTVEVPAAAPAARNDATP